LLTAGVADGPDDVDVDDMPAALALPARVVSVAVGG
jgi:hypothetical protein